MRHLFYTAVEGITEHITGLENGMIKLWELPKYLEVSGDVTIYLNMVCLLVTLLLGISIADIIYKCFKRKHV